MTVMQFVVFVIGGSAVVYGAVMLAPVIRMIVNEGNDR